MPFRSCLTTEKPTTAYEEGKCVICGIDYRKAGEYFVLSQPCRHLSTCTKKDCLKKYFGHGSEEATVLVVNRTRYCHIENPTTGKPCGKWISHWRRTHKVGADAAITLRNTMKRDARDELYFKTLERERAERCETGEPSPWEVEDSMI